MDKSVVIWLLEESDPHVRYRALRELLGMPREHEDCVKTRAQLLASLPQAVNRAWQLDCKGLWLIYHLTALAECGLTRDDIDVETAAARALEPSFDAGCGDAMLLRALVMLGCGADARVREKLDAFKGALLPDGGFLCLHRRGKRADTPKSCYKADLHALLLSAECAKRHIDAPALSALPNYFLRRNIFYRTDAPETPVLGGHAGWRTTDAFHPQEVMRVGVHNVVEALCALGHGKTAPCKHARSVLDTFKNDAGRYTLAGTLSKSYLPKERIGAPSKWVTLYALLAGAGAG